MSRRAVESEQAPRAIGPYSQAVESGNLVILSGQIGLDPRTGDLVSGGIEAETERVLENLKAVLEAAGLSFADVVRTTIYLIDLADFAKVNEIYARYVATPYPARATVGVSALPKGARIEIDAIATRTR